MNSELPASIAGFFQAHNSGKTDGFDALFTADAVVGDEQHEYQGAAIKGWIDKAISQYKPSAEVSSFETNGDKTVVAAQVSGTFPGSPVQLRYSFTLSDGKIAALFIVA